MTDKIEQTNFFILPTWRVGKILKDTHEEWLKTPDQKGQKHNEHPKRHLDVSKHSKELSKHENNWDLLWNK